MGRRLPITYARVREPLAGIAFVAPALLVLAVVLGFPLVAALLQSVNVAFTERSAGFSLLAYRALLTDASFHRSAINTLVFVTATVSLHLSIGLAVALMLNLKMRFIVLLRVIALLPWTVPDVVAGMIWRFMMDPLSGFTNALIAVFRPTDAPIDWLGSPLLAFFCLILAEGWRAYPFIMLVLLAGLQAISETQYEAAQIDGANAWQRLRYITLPNLKMVLIIAVILDIIWECRLFGMVFSLTGGGPADTTQVLSLLIYQQNFEYYNTTTSAAMAIVLALGMLVLSIPYVRLTMGNRT